MRPKQLLRRSVLRRKRNPLPQDLTKGCGYYDHSRAASSHQSYLLETAREFYPNQCPAVRFGAEDAQRGRRWQYSPTATARIEGKIGVQSVFDYNRQHPAEERIPLRLLIINRMKEQIKISFQPESSSDRKKGEDNIMDRNATVIMARCQRSKKPFGIRTEKMNDGVWHCTWTFPLKEQAAAREGYSDTMVSGRVGLDEEYPGCPYCEAEKWFSCSGCGKLTCQGTETHVVCAWCGNSGETYSAQEFDLRGGGY